jgi:SAM-dependent methyltransferase
MSDPNSADAVRERVSESYAKALTTSSCCGPKSCGEGSGVTAQAGYDAADLGAVPDDAAQNSFGCGNPVAFSGVQPGDTVLDLGAGAGIDLILAAQKVGREGHVIGVDMTDDMIERARANIAAAGLSNVEVRKGIIEELPVEAGTVDWVISNCVINLSPEKDRVFAEIARVLKPGGQMLVSDIVANDLPEWVRESAAMYSACVSGAIGETDYLGGLQAAGLVDVEVRGRLVYDALSIKELLAGEVPGLDELDPETIQRAAEAVEGKVQSVSVYGRKPS